MKLKRDTKFGEESTCCFKIGKRNLTKFWPEQLKVSKSFTLIGSFWAKYISFELQKYRGVTFHDSEEICKFWRKTDLLFEKRLEKFDKFWPEHLKVSELELWWDPFVQGRKGITLKFSEKLCVMTMKNNAKFGEELTSFQNWQEFNEFWLEHSKI